MADAIPAPASRNDPCPCGSGQRYKHCHGNLVAAAPLPSAPALRDAALDAHEAGRLDEAERGYRAALAIDPTDADCLHLLGVLRLRRLDFDDARRCLEAACRLTGWQDTGFRRRYLIALTAELGARSPPELAARIAALEARRQARATTRPQRVQRLVITADDPKPATARTAVVQAGMHTVVPVAASTDAATMLARLDQALADSDADWVVLTDDTHDAGPDLDAAGSDAAARGADWAIAAPMARAAQAAAGTDAAPDWTALALAPRLGPALLADAALVAANCNLLFRPTFLRSLLAAAPADLGALLLDALWQSEPVLVPIATAKRDAPARDATPFLASTTTTSSTYVERAITDATPPNPLAPCAHVDGLRFLREPARRGLGERLDGRTLLAAAQRIDEASTAPIATALRDDGIELIGYARAETGEGQSLRLYGAAALAAGIPLAVSDLPLPATQALAHAERSMDLHIVDAPTQRIRLVCANPDPFGAGALVDGEALRRRCLTIGSWYWELERPPATWADHQRLYDAFWAPTGFVAGALRQAVDKPVHVLMPPVPVPVVDARFRRADFGLPDHAFVYLYSFDYLSYASRKRPEAVVRAFRRAFPRGDEAATLVIKTHRSQLHARAHASLLAEAAGDPRIRTIDRALTRAEITALQALSDAYVSLHRSEGLGLGLAECMALGKPTIATRWSGNLAFMDDGNSLLVDFQLIDIAPGEYPDAEGQRWADASIEHAAVLMRRLHDDRDYAARLGAAARRDIIARHSPAAVGARMAALLAEMREQPRAD